MRHNYETLSMLGLTSSHHDTKSTRGLPIVKSVTTPAHMVVAVSTVIFALRPSSTSSIEERPALWLPLVRRTRSPYEGRWALPGGWVGGHESLSDAGRRTLAETTGLRPSYLEQLYTFGRPDRSPGERVISTIYTALVRSHEVAQTHETENVGWFEADPEHLPSLAFDHAEIVDYALWRLRTKVEYADVALHFLGERFTLAQLREVYEAILGRPLDPANFRRRVEASGSIVATEEHLTGGRHRPPRLYRPDATTDGRAVGPAA